MTNLPGRAASRSVNGQPRALRVTMTVAVSVAGLLASLALQPPRVAVNGAAVPIGPSWTVADCAQAAGLRVRDGDLLDVSGELLMRGGGRKAKAWLDGALAGLDNPVAPGCELVLEAATDVPETVMDDVEYLNGGCVDEGGRRVANMDAAQFVPGLRRTVRGRISEKLVRTETAFASVVVYSSDAPSRPPCMALTFDDGPCDPWTGKILDVLAEYGARATFCCMARAVPRHAAVFARTIAEGHEVASHSWGHPMYTKLTTDAARGDLQRSLDTMRKGGAKEIRLFRPPWGEYDARIQALASSFGLKIAKWDIDTLDWQRPGVDAICARVLSKARDGAVVLFHDGPARRDQTVAALRRVIPELRRRGYSLVTMSEARGHVPMFGGEVVLKVGETTYRLKPLPASTVTTVGGRPVQLPFPPLEIAGDYLVAVRPIALALGARVTYDKPAETVTVRAGSRVAVFRLDSRIAEIDGEQRELSVPPVLYLGQGAVPVSVLKDILGLRCVHDAAKRTLRLDRVAPNPNSRQAPQATQARSGFGRGRELHADLRDPRGPA